MTRLDTWALGRMDALVAWVWSWGMAYPVQMQVAALAACTSALIADLAYNGGRIPWMFVFTPVGSILQMVGRQWMGDTTCRLVRSWGPLVGFRVTLTVIDLLFFGSLDLALGRYARAADNALFVFFLYLTFAVPPPKPPARKKREAKLTLGAKYAGT